jgi:hypothetical protein
MPVRPEDTRESFRDAPLTRLRAELYCLGLVFWFWDGNNHARKAATIVLVSTWGVVTVGLTFDSLSTAKPPFYIVLTGIVFLIIGRMWDIQINNFAGVELNNDSGSDSEGDDGGS